MKRVLIIIPQERSSCPDTAEENVMLFLGTRHAERLESQGMIGIKENVRLTERDLDFIEATCKDEECSFILLQDKTNGKTMDSYGEKDYVVCDVVNYNDLWKES